MLSASAGVAWRALERVLRGVVQVSMGVRYRIRSYELYTKYTSGHRVAIVFYLS